MILITGSSGLIGRHICRRLRAEGMEYREFDLKNDLRQDVRNTQSVQEALKDVSGVVHLAAVSRVVWAERDPQTCMAVNNQALKTLIDLAMAGTKPWLVFASSREVYGSADAMPVSENAPLRPVNVYGRSKLQGELDVQAAGEAGLLANICRFSNVFGCPHDHPDRVVMAFARAAAMGGAMSIEGGENTFDFTAIEDVVEGLFRLIMATTSKERLPPIHFVSGRGTTLRELASITAAYAPSGVDMVESPPRTFDVDHFVGDPARAKDILGWCAEASLASRVGRLVAAFSPRVNADGAVMQSNYGSP